MVKTVRNKRVAELESIQEASSVLVIQKVLCDILRAHLLKTSSILVVQSTLSYFIGFSGCLQVSFFSSAVSL